MYDLYKENAQKNESLTMHHIKVRNMGFGLLHTHTVHTDRQNTPKSSILNPLGRPERERALFMNK
jgi:hypothetical protein